MIVASKAITFEEGIMLLKSGRRFEAQVGEEFEGGQHFSAGATRDSMVRGRGKGGRQLMGREQLIVAPDRRVQRLLLLLSIGHGERIEDAGTASGHGKLVLAVRRGV